jgi:DNA replication protein DnaC
VSELIHARVVDRLQRLYLGHVAQRLDAILSTAARDEPTYLDFLDRLLEEEVASKQRKRVAMGIQIAHFPAVKTLEDFDFKFQPSIDAKLVRELASGRYASQAENVLVFGPPGVGKTHLAIALGRAAVEAGLSTLFTSATALLSTLAKAETEGQLADCSLTRGASRRRREGAIRDCQARGHKSGYSRMRAVKRAPFLT